MRRAANIVKDIGAFSAGFSFILGAIGVAAGVIGKLEWPLVGALALAMFGVGLIVAQAILLRSHSSHGTISPAVFLAQERELDRLSGLVAHSKRSSGSDMRRTWTALSRLRLLREVGVLFLLQRDPILDSEGKVNIDWFEQLARDVDTWERMVIEIERDTSGADVEWDRFKTKPSSSDFRDRIKTRIDNLDALIARLSP